MADQEPERGQPVHEDALQAQDVGVDVGEREADGTAAVGCIIRPIHSEVRNLGEPLERVGRDLMLVLTNRLHPDRREVVDGRTETDRLGLYFFDSRTTAQSVADRVALRLGTPCVTNRLFIDEVKSKEAIAERLDD